MKLTRGKRIALELLGPPALGVIIVMAISYAQTLWIVLQDEKTPKLEPGLLKPFGLLIFAYLFAGIPSVIYTMVMEWRFTKGLDPESWRTIQFSACLGTMAGIFVGLLLSEFHLNSAFWLMSGIGLIVGFLMGLLIKWWSTEKKTTGENPP